MKMSNEKVTIYFDSTDWKGMLKLMNDFGDTDTPFYGKTEDGETIEIGIYKDRISTRTYQNNNWVRLNVFHDDGTSEELFDGRWV